MTTCTIQAFDGCDCLPGDCRSASHRIGEINRKIRAAEARRRADGTLMAVASALCIGAWAFSFVFFAIPESQRLARVNQEQVSVR